ncbi:hypothetical protein AVEN_19480-1 [Araneus ventricosus]|uniref:Uncharacterized protein n=1 Tax=Araneus ventricosus TaxID=182803 RepID=A0A4Y2GW43_ARAVE|nr:hypothetical protein AVEN_19480-1 [Araneus ventricosus]
MGESARRRAILDSELSPGFECEDDDDELDEAAFLLILEGRSSHSLLQTFFNIFTHRTKLNFLKSLPHFEKVFFSRKPAPESLFIAETRRRCFKFRSNTCLETKLDEDWKEVRNSSIGKFERDAFVESP